MKSTWIVAAVCASLLVSACGRVAPRRRSDSPRVSPCASAAPFRGAGQPPMHVRAVHYDHHNGETVALLELEKPLLGKHVAVCVGRREAASERIEGLAANNWVHLRKGWLTHTFGLVRARLDEPPAAGQAVTLVHDGIRYTPTVDWSRPQPRSDEFKAALCMATMRGEPRFAREFVEFQFRRAGAEHAWMYNGGGLDPGLEHWLMAHPNVTLVDWRPVFGADQIWDASQHLAYIDCTYRARQRSRFAAFLDTDDFIQNSNYQDLAESGDCVPCCTMDWRTVFVDAGLRTPDNSTLQWWDVPERAVCSTTRSEGNSKAFHSLMDVREVSSHTAFSHHCKRLPVRQAYIAHTRPGRRMPKECTK